MRAPWLLVTLALLTGIVVVPALPVEPVWVLVAACTAAAIALIHIIFDRRHVACFFLFAAFAAVGGLLALRAIEPTPLERAFSSGSIGVKELVDVEGTIAAHPERRPEALVFPLVLRRLVQKGSEREMAGMLRVRVALSESWKGDKLPFRWGDRIRFSTHLRPLVASGNPGVFDFTEYLRRAGISHTATADSPMSVRIIAREGGPLALISGLKARLELVIAETFRSPEGVDQKGAMLEALILGNRSLLEERNIAALRRAGLMHIIAISGFHVWALGLLCVGLFRLARIPNRWAYAITTAVTLLYWGLAGGRNSVTRAVVVALIYYAGKIFSRRTFSLNGLAFAAFAILFFAPLDLFDAGFQLTFGAALGIVLFTDKLHPWFFGFGWWGDALAVGIASQLFVLPLVAWHFHMVNLQSVLTSFLVFPLVSFAVLGGFLFLLFLRFIPFIAELTAAALSFVFGMLFELSNMFDRILPFALRLPSPPLWLLTAYIACLLGWRFFQAGQKPAEEEPLLRPPWGLVPAAVLLLLIIVNPFVQPPTGSWRLHQIDVGQGSSLLIETPDGKAALVDGGGTPMDDYDIGENVVSPYLWARGHRGVDLVIVTHGDEDHLEGLVTVLRNFPVRALWLPRGLPRTPLVEELLDIGVRRGVQVSSFNRNEQAIWGETDWQFFNPPSPPYTGRSVSNRNSIVARARLADFSLLVSGDADKPALREIIAAGDALRADILCVPHHGSDDALDPAFLAAVSPRIALIAAGYENRFGFPKRSVLKALTACGASIYSTSDLGAVVVTRTGGSFELHAGRQLAPLPKLPTQTVADE